ncbi:hypothetical protein [Lysinibacillus xylanilyticus]|uniref:hypothetical protein n=1 Tax=Lysinibacillus xylanilyticus TaxID=582475 RepID=UPI003D088CB2
MFSVAKAKRQLQSAQPERKSTTRYVDELRYYYSQFLKNLSLQSKNLMQITSGFKSLFC